jgi:hypothetical protein
MDMVGKPKSPRLSVQALGTVSCDIKDAVDAFSKVDGPPQRPLCLLRLR